jgi:hypothetical protein
MGSQAVWYRDLLAAALFGGIGAAGTFGRGENLGRAPDVAQEAQPVAEARLARLAADEISQSGQVDVKNRLKRAGFSYQEHMGRGQLPPVAGTEFNSAGQNLLDEIITKPDTAWRPITAGKFVGGLYGLLPNGQGAAIDAYFQFQYFGVFRYPGPP